MQAEGLVELLPNRGARVAPLPSLSIGLGVVENLVVTERGWAENSVGEWFPALAERTRTPAGKRGSSSGWWKAHSGSGRSQAFGRE